MLDAVLERITYANEETGYTIARVATDRSGSDLLTVSGSRTWPWHVTSGFRPRFVRTR